MKNEQPFDLGVDEHNELLDEITISDPLFARLRVKSFVQFNTVL